MERKFEIPRMSNEDIARWYATIKPIVNNAGISTYLRQDFDVGGAFTFLRKTDYAEAVDFGELSVLADVKMLHKYFYIGFFIPSIEEVIRQIPSEILEKVVAFERLYDSDTLIDFNDIFNEEVHQGFHVSVVRLYQAKNDMNEKAEPVKRYPVKESTLPIGMSEEQFQRLKASYGIED